MESAVYFAVAELLANVAKHARATEVTVELGYGTRMLTATVTDDGRGGAAASEGSGLAGLERRAAAFGGRLERVRGVGPPGAHHDFDLYESIRSAAVNQAVEQFAARVSAFSDAHHQDWQPAQDS